MLNGEEMVSPAFMFKYNSGFLFEFFKSIFSMVSVVSNVEVDVVSAMFLKYQLRFLVNY